MKICCDKTGVGNLST